MLEIRKKLIKYIYRNKRKRLILINVEINEVKNRGDSLFYNFIKKYKMNKRLVLYNI